MIFFVIEENLFFFVWDDVLLCGKIKLMLLV